MKRKQPKAPARAASSTTPPPESPETAAVVLRLFAQAQRHYQAGQLAEAATAYREALALRPDSGGAHVNLGNILRELGRLDEAVSAYRSAIAAMPNQPVAHYNLGVVLRTLGDLEGARDAYRQALALKPNLAQAHCNLGTVLRDLGQAADAAAAFRSGLVHSPDDPDLHNNLAAVLRETGKPDEAIASYAKALALNPESAEAVGNLAHAHRQVCDWRTLEQEEESCRNFVRRGIKGINPQHFLSIAASAAEQAQCAMLQTETALIGTGRLPAPGRTRREKLHIGYLSGDFRDHPVVGLFAEIFDHHDRDRFEVSAYSYGPHDASPARRHLMETTDRFVDIRPLAHADAAKQIRADGIDILVDLTGHADQARTAILAWRPAPIQVNFLGFLGTMAAEFIDYIIADAVTVPMAEQPFFAERIVHLPDCFMPGNGPMQMADQRPSRTDCGLREAGMVFCSFVQPGAITPQCFDVWMQVLRAVPDSTLWLLEPGPSASANLRREARARDIDGDRLVFARRLPLANHLAQQRLADLFLDPLPTNAYGATNLALATGLPVLTHAGATFSGRGTASQLYAAGLPELVTQSAEDYAALAVRLGTESGVLQDLRQRLETARATAPLFDPAHYTRQLEVAYRRMRDIWEDGRAPESFAVGQ